ncbi:MAG: bifunctional diguanylate cyclase/phosphodiesterase [Terracidiphilus sp.]|nr:bifunctional diguanylate cyclase/phosphodiesterase [Terracidiphilus sp.]
MPLQPSALIENSSQASPARHRYRAIPRLAASPESPERARLDHELPSQILAYAQRYDMQTGLMNYRSFQESLARLLQNGPPGQQVALLWIEILSLRRAFTLYGSKGTGELVQHVAQSLRSALDSGMLVGRFNDGCFLVALAASKSATSCKRRIQAVVDSILPTCIPGSHTRLEVASGVAFCPSDAQSPEGLVRFAGLAASCAAAVMSPSVLPFRSNMHRHLLRSHRLEAEMHKGLDQGQFHNVYQPKVNLATGEVLGAETLIRWNHPRWGFIPPCTFIPIAEQSNLIHRIMDFNLRTALKDAQSWRGQGLSMPLISVNASAVNLRHDAFVPSVRALLAELPIAPTKLELEVTESVLFEDEELFASRVRQLKTMGVRIAIDDFGTRYTGFNVLRNLPLDTMKIDQCFIHGIDRSPKMLSLCQTIVAMAKQLKMRTVAEGVEEPAEMEALQQIGCDAGQGYLFQRPVPATELAQFLSGWQTQMLAYKFDPARETPVYVAAVRS